MSAQEVVTAWNDAHVKHDARALEALYAPSVDFYGKTLSPRECAERKKTAFAKDPDYTQSIRDVRIDPSGAASIVTFTKTSTVKGKSTDYPAIVVVVGEVIVSETDTITKANLAAQEAQRMSWCVDSPAYPPNDRVIAPYRISALQAYRRARKSALFKAHEAASHGDFLDFGQIYCPTECVHVTDYPYEEAAAHERYVGLLDLGRMAVRRCRRRHDDLAGWHEREAAGLISPVTRREASEC